MLKPKELLCTIVLDLEDFENYQELQVIALRPLSEKFGHLFYEGHTLGNQTSAPPIK